jgi:hypothetical protein
MSQLSDSPSSGGPPSAIIASVRNTLRNSVVAAFNGQYRCSFSHRFTLSLARCRAVSLFQPPHKPSSPLLRFVSRLLHLLIMTACLA